MTLFVWILEFFLEYFFSNLKHISCIFTKLIFFFHHGHPEYASLGLFQKSIRINYRCFCFYKYLEKPACSASLTFIKKSARCIRSDLLLVINYEALVLLQISELNALQPNLRVKEQIICANSAKEGFNFKFECFDI